MTESVTVFAVTSILNERRLDYTFWKNESMSTPNIRVPLGKGLTFSVITDPFICNGCLCEVALVHDHQFIEFYPGDEDSCRKLETIEQFKQYLDRALYLAKQS